MYPKLHMAYSFFDWTNMCFITQIRIHIPKMLIAETEM